MAIEEKGGEVVKKVVVEPRRRRVLADIKCDDDDDDTRVVPWSYLCLHARGVNIVFETTRDDDDEEETETADRVVATLSRTTTTTRVAELESGGDSARRVTPPPDGTMTEAIPLPPCDSTRTHQTQRTTRHSFVKSDIAGDVWVPYKAGEFFPAQRDFPEFFRRKKTRILYYKNEI